MLHFLCLVFFSCCPFFVTLFFVALWQNCIISMLHFFQCCNFLCCILYMLHSFHVLPFVVLHTFGVAIFPRCTFFILYFFHVSPFCVLRFFRLVLFSCCTLFRFDLCCTHFMMRFFVLYSFRVAIFPRCTLSFWTLFRLHFPLVVHFFLQHFFYVFSMISIHVELISCCTFFVFYSFLVSFFPCLLFLIVVLFSYWAISRVALFWR